MMDQALQGMGRCQVSLHLQARMVGCLLASLSLLLLFPLFMLQLLPVLSIYDPAAVALFPLLSSNDCSCDAYC